jgi:hypothetical protein
MKLYQLPFVHTLDVSELGKIATQGTGDPNVEVPETTLAFCSDSPGSCLDEFGGTQALGSTCSGPSAFQVFIFIPGGNCGAISLPCDVAFNNQVAPLNFQLTCVNTDPSDCSAGIVITREYGVPSGTCDSGAVIQLVNCADGGVETCSFSGVPF